MSLKGLGGLFRHGVTLSHWDAQGQGAPIDPVGEIGKHCLMYWNHDITLYAIGLGGLFCCNCIVIFGLARLRREYQGKVDHLKGEVEDLKAEVEKLKK